jgi:alkylation response protein AidB-like acyl-CoA dehydrogenase
MVWHPAVPLKQGTPEQIRDFLTPSCLGKRRACVAVTEPDAGSDTGSSRREAMRREDRYVIDGEKWFVTSFDEADYVDRARARRRRPGEATLFLVDRDARGLSRQARAEVHPHLRLFSSGAAASTASRSERTACWVAVGMGLELTKDWFVEARLQIAANCLGAAIRGFELANDWASRRVQFGAPIRRHQAIEFMLADMAVEIMARKSMVYRVAWEIDQNIDRKVAHARASAIKLHASEMAGRVLDKAVQIFGGRGYMREKRRRAPEPRRARRPDLEGTSEIQRVIIGGQLAKRGPELFTGWYR